MASYRSTLLFAFHSNKNNNFLTFSKEFCFGKLKSSQRRTPRFPNSPNPPSFASNKKKFILFVEPSFCKRRLAAPSVSLPGSFSTAAASPLFARRSSLRRLFRTGFGCMGISNVQSTYQRSSPTMSTLLRTCNLAFFLFFIFHFFSFLELERFLHTHGEKVLVLAMHTMFSNISMCSSNERQFKRNSNSTHPPIRVVV